MTDNQIVMLMERCYEKEKSVVITQFNSDDTKTEITLADILGVINRKNAEIERLQKLLDDKCDRCIANERAKANKELADKIESRLANNTDISNAQYQSIIFDINEACKETVGEG